MSSGKLWPFCLGLSVIKPQSKVSCYYPPAVLHLYERQYMMENIELYEITLSLQLFCGYSYFRGLVEEMEN